MKGKYVALLVAFFAATLVIVPFAQAVDPEYADGVIYDHEITGAYGYVAMTEAPCWGTSGWEYVWSGAGLLSSDYYYLAECGVVVEYYNGEIDGFYGFYTWREGEDVNSSLVYLGTGMLDQWVGCCVGQGTGANEDVYYFYIDDGSGWELIGSHEYSSSWDADQLISELESSSGVGDPDHPHINIVEWYMLQQQNHQNWYEVDWDEEYSPLPQPGIEIYFNSYGSYWAYWDPDWSRIDEVAIGQ